jgi:hypothetical protein
VATAWKNRRRRRALGDTGERHLLAAAAVGISLALACLAAASHRSVVVTALSISAISVAWRRTATPAARHERREKGAKTAKRGSGENNGGMAMKQV